MPEVREESTKTASSGRGRMTAPLNSVAAVAAQNQASQHCSLVWEGIHKPQLLTKELRAAGGF